MHDMLADEAQHCNVDHWNDGGDAGGGGNHSQCLEEDGIRMVRRREGVIKNNLLLIYLFLHAHFMLLTLH